MKSDAVSRSGIGKNSLATVRIIRRTKPSVSHTINTAGDAVAVTSPCPAHRIAFDYVHSARHKREALPHGHIPHPRARSFARSPARTRSGCWSGGDKWRVDER
jgi:hypothetical protein